MRNKAGVPAAALGLLLVCGRTAFCAAEAVPAAARAAKTPEAAFKSEQDKVLYALGTLLGRNLSVFSLSETELKLVAWGMKDSVLGRKPEVDIGQYGGKVEILAQMRRKAAAQQEKLKAKAFLDKAGAEAGAVVTPSGLVYKELKAGEGPSPSASDKVRVHYHGTLPDGTVFDSSVQRGEPAEFPLSGVIPCWTEGVQRMKVGGKSRLICPSSIAYGDSGAPPSIPGGATLVFEVELLSIPK